MAHSLLSEIHKDSHQWTICVLVSRMWHYRGGTDEGPIKHTDLVLLDNQGNHMYGQIPAGSVNRFKDELEEGKVYVIRKFLCTVSRTTFRPVEAPFMVQFTRYTIAEPRPGLENAFPFCTYALTAFDDIPRPSGPPARFIDVIGRITSVSELIPIQSMYSATPSNTRTIILEDLQGKEMRLVLWGDRAVEFNANIILDVGGTEPVIAIFVGTLPKTSQGIKSLSGSSACRWYIGEDIPDINSFRASLGDRFAPVAAYIPKGLAHLVSRVQDDPVPKTVKELNDLDPFVDMDKRFFCTVTIDRIGSDQRWWFPSCSTCRKSAKHTGYQYQCSDDKCSSVDADLTYCISVFASDGTAEAEFMLFDKVAAGAVGKSLVALLRLMYPGYATVDDIANVATHNTTVPRELSRLIGQKYKLLVCISKKWKYKNTTQDADLSFQVNRIEETYKPDLPPIVFGAASGSAGVSSSASGSGAHLPPLGPIMSPPYTPPAHGFHAAQERTPPSSAAKLAPSTPVPMSSAPMRGARRSLFNTPSKDSEEAIAEDPVTSQLKADALVEDPVDAAADSVREKDDENLSLMNNPAAEDKDNENLGAKNKRGAGGKAGGSVKKSRQ